MKLYNIYDVISNKTVRKNENFYKKFKPKHKKMLGTLIQTNRGYFIDGFQVDLVSKDFWMECNQSQAFAEMYYDSWQAFIKKLNEN